MEENKKELIRKAAIKVMAEMGFYNTKASRIADEAGIAVGTIYNYFNSKEDILEYIFAVELEKRMVYLEQVKNVEADFWEKLEIFLRKHFNEIKDNPDTGKILVSEKEFPRKSGSKAIGDYLYAIPDKLDYLLTDALKNGEVKECNPEITAAIIFGAIQGVVEKAIKNDNLTLLDSAPEELLKLLKRGLNI